MLKSIVSLDNEEADEILKNYIYHFPYHYYIIVVKKLKKIEIEKINRLFNLYIKKEIETKDINKISNLFNFISTIIDIEKNIIDDNKYILTPYETDSGHLTSNNKESYFDSKKFLSKLNQCKINKGIVDDDRINKINDKLILINSNNVSNLFKYLSVNNIYLFDHITYTHIDKLIDHLIMYNIDFKYKFYQGILSIILNYFKYMDDFFLKNKYYDKLTWLDDIYSKFNFNTYNKLISIFNLKIKKFTYWVKISEMIKITQILQFTRFINNSNFIDLKNIYNCHEIYNVNKEGIWFTNCIILKQVIILRNILTNYEVNKNIISNFIDSYNSIIRNFLLKNNKINVIIDGMNKFYNSNKNNKTDNINLKKIMDYDNNINNNNLLITKYLNNKNILYSNKQPKVTNYVIFNEMYKDMLDTIPFKNIFILYSPKHINDDIIQLYMFLSYPNTILISNDKHSNYINNLKNNDYYINLFNEIKNIFQVKNL